MTGLTRREWMMSVAGMVPAAAWRGSQVQHGALVFVGTYTGPKSQGIYAFRFDHGTGTLTPAGLAAATPSPSFLAAHPSGRWLLAVNELDSFEGERSGSVSAFAIDHATGRLALINTVSSRGAHPCHLSIDRTGTRVLVANYTGGNVAVLPIAPDGRLGAAASVVQHAGSGAHASRQRGPHAHAIDVDATNRFALAADLGIDQVLVYRLDPAQATLVAHAPAAAALPPGSGPRHFAVAPDGRRVYVINELNSTIATFAWDASAGRLTPVSDAWRSVSTVPPGFSGENSTAEVQVHPSGRFLYGSNRGHDSIAVFRIDEDARALQPAGHVATGGKTPRHFTLTADGQWLLAANQGSDSITVFKVDAATGHLTATGSPASVGTPVCVVFAPASR